MATIQSGSKSRMAAAPFMTVSTEGSGLDALKKLNLHAGLFEVSLNVLQEPTAAS